MGSPEDLSVLIDGLLRVLLGTLAVVTARTRTVSILGLAWLLLAIFDFSILWRPEWTTWAEMGSYWIFTSAMLAIAWEGWHGHLRTISTRRGRASEAVH